MRKKYASGSTCINQVVMLVNEVIAKKATWGVLNRKWLKYRILNIIILRFSQLLMDCCFDAYGCLQIDVFSERL